MARTIPIIGGQHVDDNWDLDNASHLKDLGLPSELPCKKVDRYAHYRNCPYALIEFTKSAIGKAVKQFQECVEYFNDRERPINRLILVIDRWSKREKDRYYRPKRTRVLYDRESRKPIIVGSSDRRLEIFIYTEEEARRTHSLGG